MTAPTETPTELCVTCDKPASQHNGMERFCPLYATFKPRRALSGESEATTPDKSLARDLVAAGYCLYRDTLRDLGLVHAAALTQREVNDLIESTVNKTLGAATPTGTGGAPTDTERLNWLEKHPMACPLMHSRGGWHTKEPVWMGEHIAPRLREAIDAAMSATPAGGR